MLSNNLIKVGEHTYLYQPPEIIKQSQEEEDELAGKTLEELEELLKEEEEAAERATRELDLGADIREIDPATLSPRDRRLREIMLEHTGQDVPEERRSVSPPTRGEVAEEEEMASLEKLYQTYGGFENAIETLVENKDMSNLEKIMASERDEERLNYVANKFFPILTSQSVKLHASNPVLIPLVIAELGRRNEDVSSFALSDKYSLEDRQVAISYITDIENLKKLVKDKATNISVSAARQLFKIDPQEAKSSILPLVKDVKTSISSPIANEIMRMGDPQDILYIIQNSPTDEIRAKAISVLGAKEGTLEELKQAFSVLSQAAAKPQPTEEYRQIAETLKPYENNYKKQMEVINSLPEDTKKRFLAEVDKFKKYFAEVGKLGKFQILVAEELAKDNDFDTMYALRNSPNRDLKNISEKFFKGEYETSQVSAEEISEFIEPLSQSQAFNVGDEVLLGGLSTRTERPVKGVISEIVENIATIDLITPGIVPSNKTQVYLEDLSKME